MKKLESQYQNTKVVRKAKQFKVVLAAKRIQRWFRRKQHQRYFQSTLVIQYHFRKYQKRKRRNQLMKGTKYISLLQHVRRSIAARKIQRAFRRKLYRSPHVEMAQPSESRLLLAQYFVDHPHYRRKILPRIVKIQTCIRGWLVRRKGLRVQERLKREWMHF